jgi:hypothetical protein
MTPWELAGAAGFVGLEFFGIALFSGVLWLIMKPRN